MKKLNIFTIILAVVMVLPVGLAAELPDLSVSMLSQNPLPVQSGQTLDLVLEVSNSGDPSSDAWVEIVEDYPFTVLPGGDFERAQNLRIVSGTQKLQFRVRVDENAHDGLTPIRVRYAETQISAYKEKEFYIQIETFGARVGVENMKQSPEELVPGQKGKISFILTNHDDQVIRNIDVVLDMAGTYTLANNMDNTLAVQAMINARLEDVNRRIAAGMSPLAGATPMGVQTQGMTETSFKAIAPVGASTLQRHGDLAKGESLSVTYDVQALPDVTPGIYSIPVFINYNDADNNPFHTRTEIPIVIDMEPDSVIQLKSSTLRSTDFAGEVKILVANRGLGELRYSTIELLDDEGYILITAPEEAYLGTLKAGESAEATFSILPEVDDLIIPVRLTFRDSYNNLVEHEEELHLEIINRNYYRDMPYEVLSVWIILGIVILILTGFFLYQIRRKK